MNDVPPWLSVFRTMMFLKPMEATSFGIGVSYVLDKYMLVAL